MTEITECFSIYWDPVTSVADGQHHAEVLQDKCEVTVHYADTRC